MPTTVGTLELASKYRYGLTSRGVPMYLFRPYDESLPEYVVGCSERDTSRNQIAIVDCPAGAAAAATEKPRSNLLRLLGPVGDYGAERAALLEHYCPAKYKDEIPDEPDTADDENRQILDAAHGWTVFHVDPPGCRDIDDAIAFHAQSRTWAIVIADAAAAVTQGSPVDMIARRIGSTFYDTAGYAERPMLPRATSEDTASLLPGQRRRGVALLCPPSTEPHFALVWCTVEHSTTYESVTASPIVGPLLAGAEPHDWIAWKMLRYNAAAARLFKDHATGILRTQSPADAAAVATWSAVSPELAYMASEAAIYTNACEDADQGHAGLGLAAYAHASSPLRRYADLQNQRILKALIRRPSPAVHTDATLATALNERQRANRRWARDLLFLDLVTPGRVHEIPVVWVDAERVWVPAWKRLLRLRHEVATPAPAPGTGDCIQIFCDPTRRNWRQRVLTAPSSCVDRSTDSSRPLPLPLPLHPTS